jgi:superfamily I DNA/RNA helicase
MALCRVNAPLIQECFRFLKLGRKANIQGRDVGQGLISLIKKQKADDITQLVAKLSEWLEKETLKERAKKRPNENKIITMQDKVDCICIFTEGCDSIRCVIDKIEGIFTDDHNTKCIKFSSIHKAKGLESDNVFLLEPKGATMPHPLAKTPQAVEQEFNLLYVAITRAIHKLVRVK